MRGNKPRPFMVRRRTAPVVARGHAQGIGGGGRAGHRNVPAYICMRWAALAEPHTERDTQAKAIDADAETRRGS